MVLWAREPWQKPPVLLPCGRRSAHAAASGTAAACPSATLAAAAVAGVYTAALTFAASGAYTHLAALCTMADSRGV